ncbi:uncharacterized protein LY89DRAFT_785246 [Mollisia scopiformis]|uniref:Uncharacterized protein n=1 Tax=Mollisia scopiformis TaxID=149040 RepID=A0A194X070_MOLSC|nr:uncharacterized protein LY89DRAFT_785246 [Mollisia scopiformis]KUJ13588.1 hypothetical protein LY89DRAFT_785246 [Mollisia scopiformis]
MYASYSDNCKYNPSDMLTKYLPTEAAALESWPTFHIGAFFLGSLFLSFSLGVWLIALAKGIPIQTAALERNQRPHVPLYLQERVPVHGSRPWKAIQSTFAFMAMLFFDTLLYQCLDIFNSSYRREEYVLWMPSFMAVSYPLALAAAFWTFCGAGCFLQLMVEAFLGRPVDVDVFFVPASIMACVWTCIAWPMVVANKLFSSVWNANGDSRQSTSKSEVSSEKLS